MRFCISTEATLLKFAVIDLQPVTPLRGIREGAGDVKGCGSTSSCSCCLFPIAVGMWGKGGEEKDLTKEQKKIATSVKLILCLQLKQKQRISNVRRKFIL